MSFENTCILNNKECKFQMKAYIESEFKNSRHLTVSILRMGDQSYLLSILKNLQSLR